jgi:DNA-binding transcriptional MerR regulator
MVKAGETAGPVLALISGPEAPRDQPSAERPPSLRVATTATFSPSDVGRVLNIPGATVRSWQNRGLIPADPPKRARHHRYFRAIDVFYLAVLSQLLAAAGVAAARAGAIARAVIYGEGKPTGTEERLDVDPPSLERIRTCQRDDSHAAAHVWHRDETAPYWLLYELGGTGETTEAAIRAAVLPWSFSERYARQHEHFGCLNLTALLTRIERGLLALVQQRTRPAAHERN